MTAIGTALPWAYLLAVRPKLQRWGATDDEVQMALPGDELVPNPGYQHTRAITINAPAAAVWPWLAQIGQGRGGFYSYDWLENLAGCEIHSADRVHPEWQDIRVGNTVAVMPNFGPKVIGVEPGRSITLESWGTYAILPVDSQTSRLIARARHPLSWGAITYLLTLEIPHFVMERKMLLGIKERAERVWGSQAADAAG
ncbi:MAG: hypothetical protein HY329_10850 [Chloroflexi bacterium]|nr:hypothetical protein [Chloroflexota bacterium]